MHIQRAIRGRSFPSEPGAAIARVIVPIDSARCPSWVMSGKARAEHIESASPPKGGHEADIR